MSLYVIGLIVDDTRAVDKLYLTGFRLADIPSEVIRDVSISDAKELLFADDGIVNLAKSQLYGYLNEYNGSADDYIKVDNFKILCFGGGNMQVHTNFNYCIINKDGKHLGKDGIALFLTGNFGLNLGYRASCNKIMHLYSTSYKEDEYLDLDSELKDLINLPIVSVDFSNSDFYDSDEDLMPYKHAVGKISTFFGVCEVDELNEKLLVMPKDCSILRIENKGISNRMSILFSPCIQKMYVTHFSLRHSSSNSNIMELNFCFSSSTANNVVDSIVNTMREAVAFNNYIFEKANIDLRLNLKYY